MAKVVFPTRVALGLLLLFFIGALTAPLSLAVEPEEPSTTSTASSDVTVGNASEVADEQPSEWANDEEGKNLIRERERECVCVCVCMW
jgi:hypothetical protein